MKLIYVLPPVLAALLGVEVLFGNGKAVGVLTESDGAPRQFAQAAGQSTGQPSPAPSKVAALNKTSPWGVDPGDEPPPEGFADQPSADGSEDGLEGTLDEDRGRASLPPAINAPPLARPVLTAAGAKVSAPRVELIET
ncbi:MULTISPECIES: hypothetical protein [unclassified Novosphingobium]|uniref:hypothetical protein n=1 Tax=unclassified Novosphingobium TaxID=2644732 RepID=UPI0025F731F9|nr:MULTISPECIES: hypothetical protein [unclassified Novosphingobium]HQV03046.1 hypothetical protein [Novosphingobium sp.]